MELSRRGMLGGVGVALAVGGVGFARRRLGDRRRGYRRRNRSRRRCDRWGCDRRGRARKRRRRPDRVRPRRSGRPFEARLLRDGDDDRRLFGTGDLDRVQGVITEDDEHLVYVSLGDAGIDALQTGLTDAGATDDPEGFTVSMTLDETEVRRVDLDEATVSALTDEEWGGVLTLPFGEESVAASVYDSLADA